MFTLDISKKYGLSLPKAYGPMIELVWSNIIVTKYRSNKKSMFSKLQTIEINIYDKQKKINN